MSALTDYIATLAARGVQLRAVRAGLQAGPVEALTEVDRATIGAHRGALLARLLADRPCALSHPGDGCEAHRVEGWAVALRWADVCNGECTEDPEAAPRST